MLILGIETATPQVGVAIGGHEGVLASFHSARARRHAETVTPAIEFVCRSARIELDEISVVAVGLGPGLFTGLRVGIATAKGVAHALRIPMIGVSSLDLLAFPVRWTGRLVVAAIDARRGEVFHAGYRRVPGGIQRAWEPTVSTPEDLRSELLARGEDVLLVGDGARAHADTFADLGGVEIAEAGVAYPSAASLVQLAHARALREEFVPPAEVAPLYLRQPDVDPGWAERPA